MQDKGFTGFPSLAFMDAEGNVLATPGGRTVPDFRSTLIRVNRYLAIKQKADSGDRTVAADLLIAEADLGRMRLDQLKARFAQLDPTAEQKQQLEAKIAALEIRAVGQRALAAYRAGRWAEASDAYQTVTEYNPEDAIAWFNLGYSLHAQGRLEEALVAHKRAGGMPGPARLLGIYNAACAYALLGDKDNAFTWLRKAAEAGYKDTAQVESDTDLTSLRDDARYKEIIALMKG